MQVLQTISFDESTNWNKLTLAMLLSVSEVTLSKYLLALILAILSSIMVTLVGGLLNLIFKNTNNNLLFYIILSFSCGIIYNSFIIPIAIKFGTHNCKYIMMIFVTLPTFIAFILRHFNIKIQNIKISYTLYLLILLIISLIIFIISYYISLCISNRDIE
ncbi:ABC-2 transporter permease [Anaerosalibacter bizertensis]